MLTPGRKKPLSSSKDVSEDISTAILKELNRGHTKGPFTTPPFQHFHLSPLGGVPKPDGSIRVILDLSIRGVHLSMMASLRKLFLLSMLSLTMQ